MLTKVLIVEDHQSVKDTVARAVTACGLPEPSYAYYCDDALLQISKAVRDQAPFELLITDLSFADDGRPQQLPDGQALISAVRKIQPGLKVLVFSSEANPVAISALFDKLSVDGFVFKGRRDTIDLKEAIGAISNGKKYVSAEFQQAVRQKNTYVFDDTEIIILREIARGIYQRDISAILEAEGKRATSVSSIEKKVKHIRETLGFNTTEQLIAYCKDYRII